MRAIKKHRKSAVLKIKRLKQRIFLDKLIVKNFESEDLTECPPIVWACLKLKKAIERSYENS